MVQYSSVFLKGRELFKFTSLMKPLQDDGDPGTWTTPALPLIGQTPTGVSCEHLKHLDGQKCAFWTPVEASAFMDTDSKWKQGLYVHHFEHFILECLPEKVTGFKLPAFQDTVWTSFLRYVGQYGVFVCPCLFPRRCRVFMLNKAQGWSVVISM